MYYIKVGVIVSISLLLLSCESPKQQSNRTSHTWKIGVALYSFAQYPFAQSLAKAQAAGASYVEGFSFQDFGSEFGGRAFLDFSGAQIAKMRKMLKSRGLTMSSMYVSAQTRAGWEKAFKLGEKLGLAYLVGEPRPKNLDFIDSLAGVYHMKFAIHEHAKGKSRYWNPDYELTVLQGKKHVGVCADLGHWVQTGLNPIKSLQELSGHVISVHAKNMSEAGKLDVRRVNLANGVINYQAVINQLQDQGFNGIIYIENERHGSDDLQNVRAGVSYLNHVRENDQNKSELND